MLRYMVMATPVFWALVLFLIWRSKKYGSNGNNGNGHSRSAQVGPPHGKSGKPAARVIQLFPQDPAKGSHKNPDEK